MTYPTVHSQLTIAENFAHHTRTYLAAAWTLAHSLRCPPSDCAALDKACLEAQILWLHVGNVAPLFNQPVDPPENQDVPAMKSNQEP